MRELKQKYKALVLQACRFAVTGGAMSLAYEDFLIDNIDRMVDRLSEDQLAHLLRNGKVLVGEIDSNEAYDGIFESITAAETCLQSPNLTQLERESLNKYVKTLRELAEEFKAHEWDL
ncbi:hypothetical protein [Cohnella silvisoli]|uniref:Uncharacterized protein n=1 Tax=Cohnella silvisoli TaxID=2873699 RepID=A0ABV1L3W3_9BACL|nr:hypothetical protein [Cohnella silvisoli]MCD9026026.1 hypothetical protein [Cohnella silvisoli]